MGRRGPPPKPTAQKRQEGTYRPDRAVANEAIPRSGVPAPPDRLGEEALLVWDRIAPELEAMGVLSLADGVALELLCDAYAEYVGARDLVNAAGQTYKTMTENGYIIRAHPAVGIAADAWRRVHKMCLEFGLTPASRSRVNGSSAEGDEGDDPWEALRLRIA